MKTETIEEAAEKHANEVNSISASRTLLSKIGFIEGAKSEAAKEYWYKEFQKDPK